MNSIKMNELMNSVEMNELMNSVKSSEPISREFSPKQRANFSMSSALRANFSWKLKCGAGPGDPRGSRGSVLPEISRKTGPNISRRPFFYCGPNVLGHNPSDHPPGGCNVTLRARALSGNGPPNPDKNHQKWWGAKRPTIFE